MEGGALMRSDAEGCRTVSGRRCCSCGSWDETWRFVDLVRLAALLLTAILSDCFEKVVCCNARCKEENKSREHMTKGQENIKGYKNAQPCTYVMFSLTEKNCRL
jgi:hypothetical protein